MIHTRYPLSIAATVLGAVAVFGSPAFASTLHVPKDYWSLSAAVAVANAGDTIVVASGVHAGPITIVAAQSGLRIEGTGKAWVENDPTSPESGAAVRVYASDVVLKGFNVRHGGRNSADPISGGVHVNGDRVTIEDMEIVHCEGPAVRVNGDDAVVRNCRVRGSKDGILANGDNATIKKCDVQMIAGSGIVVDGKGAVVRDCLVKRVRLHGIDVNGSNAKITKNVVVGASQGGVKTFGGRPMVVDRNVVRWTGGNATSIEIMIDSGHTETGYAEATRNRCEDGGGGGIWMSGEALGRIVDNQVLRCGSGSAMDGSPTGAMPGIHASNKDAIDNRVEDWAGTGIRAAGTQRLIIGNVVRGCLADGIQISSGNSVEVRDNTARNNLGEGIENRGNATALIGNVAKKNRIDIANTGSFSVFSDNKHKTGGVDQTPEVD